MYYHDFYPPLEEFEVLEKGTLLAGKSDSKNRGMLIELFEDFYPKTRIDFLEAKVKIKNTGNGSYSLYLEQYTDKEYEIDYIIKEVSDTFKVDLSSLFNILFLEKVNEFDSNKPLFRFNSLLSESFEPRYIGGERNPQQVLISIAIVTLLIDLFRNGHKLGFRNFLVHSSSSKKNQLSAFIKTKENNFSPTHFNFYLNIFESYDYSNEVTDFTWVDEIEELIQLNYKKHTSEFNKIISNNILHYSSSSQRKEIGSFYDSSMLSDTICAFIKDNEKIESIYDPAVGLANSFLKTIQRLTIKPKKIYAKEIMPDLYHFAGLKMILEKVPILELKNEDALNSELNPVDLVISHPPFGGKIPKTSNYLEKKTEGAFIEHTLKSLTKKGKAIIVIPLHWLDRTGKLKTFLIQENFIDAVVELPQLHKRTRVNLALLILKKKRNTQNIFIANLSEYKSIKEDEEDIQFIKDLTIVAKDYLNNTDNSKNTKKITFHQIKMTSNYSLVPSFYIFKEEDKLNTFLNTQNISSIEDVISGYIYHTPVRKRISDNYVPARIINYKNWGTIKNNLFFDIAKVGKELSLVPKEKLLKENTIILKESDIRSACIFEKEENTNLEYGVGKFVINLIPDTSKILPQYLVEQIKSEFTEIQLRRRQYGNGYALKRFSISQLKEIKIKLPPIQEQLKALSSKKYKYPVSNNSFNLVEEEPLEYNKYAPQIPIDKVIQHYIRNQIRPVDTYMGLLRNFIDKLPGNAEGELWTKGINEASEVTLRKVYHKISYFHKDLENIVTNFEDLGNLQKELIFERRSLKKVLGDFSNSRFGKN